MSTNTSPVIDINVLMGLRSLQRPNKPSIVKTIIQVFLQSSPEIADQIRTGFSKNDLLALSDASHSLKSSAASVGAVRLSEICLRLERFNPSSGESVQELMTIFETEYADAIAAFERLDEAA